MSLELTAIFETKEKLTPVTGLTVVGLLLLQNEDETKQVDDLITAGRRINYCKTLKAFRCPIPGLIVLCSL